VTGAGDGAAEVTRAVEVITSALLDRIARGEIRHDGRIPPFAMAAAGADAGIGSGALRYALRELVTAGALRLDPGRGYCLRSRTALDGHVKAGAR
jgi:DNA-binding GntR family transcriptional regulator